MKNVERSPDVITDMICCGESPAAYSTAMIEPMELEMMKSGSIPFSSIYSRTPRCANARALPPVSTRPMGSLSPPVLSRIRLLNSSSPYAMGISARMRSSAERPSAVYMVVVPSALPMISASASMPESEAERISEHIIKRTSNIFFLIRDPPEKHFFNINEVLTIFNAEKTETQHFQTACKTKQPLTQ